MSADRKLQLWQEAWDRLPLPMLMTKLGDGHFTVKGAECPFCGDTKKRWGVYKEGNRHFFKCHKPECPANNPEHGHGEIGYILLRTGKTLDDAKLEYLRLALPDHLDEIDKLFADDIPGIPPPEARRGEPKNKTPDPRLGVEARNIWHLIWQRLGLTAADRDKLKKRGFSDETIDRRGHRSNNHTNKAIIEALTVEVGIPALVEEGIYKDDEFGLRLNRQLYGYGPTGEDDQGRPILEITEPVIIPYLDAEGFPFFLRPHKGGIARPKDQFDDSREIIESLGEDRPCGGHVYVGLDLMELLIESDGKCILTEGEHKVDALTQCRIPAIAGPGITFISNPTFQKELFTILATYGVKELVVSFDNEVKDDPDLPARYVANPTKRYETQVMAEYACIVLKDFFSRIKGRVGIGWLPNETRINGKADFDGVLAGFVHGVKGHALFTHALGLKDGTAKARAVFRKVISAASEKTHVDLFPTESRRIIEWRIQQIFNPPTVKSGGDRENKLRLKFKQLSPVTVLDTDENPILSLNEPIDKVLAEAFHEVKGSYYKRDSVKPAQYSELKASLKAIESLLKSENSLTKQQLSFVHIKKAALHERLRGLPAAISDFTLTCEFKLHPHDGRVIYLVKLRNRHDKGKSATLDHLYRLPPDALGKLSEFKVWITATGRGTWKGRGEELDNLSIDMHQHSYMRDIFEINHYGEHKETGIWFYGDAAWVLIGDEMNRLGVDHDGIFWHAGVGYQISSNTEGGHFEQGDPLLLSPQSHSLSANSAIGPPTQIFTQLCRDLFDTIGSYEGWLALAMTLAYAAGPELRELGGNPGNWIIGKMSSGKTTVARWLMRVWGFKHLPGIRLDKSSTPVGVNRVLAQYSGIPVFFDEFRQDECDPQILSIMRGGFDRSTGVKGVANAASNKTRSATALTTPFVTGETPANDSATKSRYAQIHVSEHNRIGNGAERFQRMQQECKHYYQLGRAIMEKRNIFAAHMLETLGDWMNSHEVKTSVPNERVRFVHGVGYAAISAMDDILQSKLQGLPAYYTFMLGHAAKSLRHVKQETFLNTFWSDLCNGIKTKKIDKDFFSIREVTPRPDGSLEQGGEKPMVALYINYGPAFNQYSADKRFRGEPTPMTRNAIDSELSHEPYFFPLPKRSGDRCHRITVNAQRQTCWVIALETAYGRTQFPMAEDFISLIADHPTIKALAARGAISTDLIPDAE